MAELTPDDIYMRRKFGIPVQGDEPLVDPALGDLPPVDHEAPLPPQNRQPSMSDQSIEELKKTEDALAKHATKDTVPKASREELSNSKDVTVTPQILGPEDAEKKAAYLEAIRQYAHGLQAQESGIQNQEEQLHLLHGVEPQKDLSPFLAAIDHISGGHLADHYKPSNQAQSYGIDIAKLENAIQGQRSKFSLAELAALNGATAGTRTALTDAQIKQTAGYGPKGMGGNSESRNTLGAANYKEKILGKDDARAIELNNLINMVSKNDPDSANLYATYRAKLAAGRGPNIAEIHAAEKMNPSLAGQAAQAYERLASGKIDPGNKAQILKNLTDMAKLYQVVRSHKFQGGKNLTKNLNVPAGVAEDLYPPSDEFLYQTGEPGTLTQTIGQGTPAPQRKDFKDVKAYNAAAKAYLGHK